MPLGFTNPEDALLEAVFRRLYHVDAHGRIEMIDPESRVMPQPHFTLPEQFIQNALRPWGPGRDIDVVVLGDDKTLAHLRASPRIIRSEIVKAAKEVADKLYDGMLMFAMPHMRTGDLAFGLYAEVVSSLNKAVEIRVGGTSGHTLPVEKGTGIYGPFHRPYMVRRAFRGRTISGGPILMKPDVYHPDAALRSGVYLHEGMRPRPFLAPSIKMNKAFMQARMREVPTRIVQRVERGT